MDPIQDLATFHRTALLLGLEDGAGVVRWAEETIDADPLAPGPVFDVVLTSPLDLTALRFALQPLVHPVEPPAVVRAIFDRLRLDLEAGRRTVGDTVTVLSQVRRSVAISAPTHLELDAFEDDLMLARAGVTGEVAPVEAAVTAWLAGFAGAEPALLAGIDYHVIRFDRVAEAASFVAAASRMFASPHGRAALTGGEEIWIDAAQPGLVRVYLTQPALALTAEAFAPLPDTELAGAGDLAVDAVLAVTGTRPLALGVAEVERLLAAPPGRPTPSTR